MGKMIEETDIYGTGFYNKFVPMDSKQRGKTMKQEDKKVELEIFFIGGHRTLIEVLYSCYLSLENDLRNSELTWAFTSSSPKVLIDFSKVAMIKVHNENMIKEIEVAIAND